MWLHIAKIIDIHCTLMSRNLTYQKCKTVDVTRVRVNSKLEFKKDTVESKDFKISMAMIE